MKRIIKKKNQKALKEDTMRGTIADSITIKVGQGIMTIPRNLEKLNKQKPNTSPKNQSDEKKNERNH